MDNSNCIPLLLSHHSQVHTIWSNKDVCYHTHKLASTLVQLLSFLINWLANFKLLLFALGKPPLSSFPPLSLPRFILLSALPIKLLNSSPSQIHTNNKNNYSPIKYFGAKLILLAIFIQIYQFKYYVHPKFITLLYCFHIYLCLEILLGGLATLARAAGGVELEPEFEEPNLSTSLQDFWGKRWNLMVSSILRRTVSDPVRSFSTRMIKRKWAPLPATLADFFCIGRNAQAHLLLCGLVFYDPWAVEMALKKVVKDKELRVPSFISRPLVIMYVLSTALWLFFSASVEM